MPLLLNRRVVSLPFKQVPLRLLLILPFIVQIFGAVSLVGYLSFRNGQRAVNELADQLMIRASQQVDTHLSSYLALPQQLNQLNAAAIAAGEIDLTDPQASARYFWRQARAFPAITYLGYALLDGSESGAGRWVNGTDLLLYENLPGLGKTSNYLADDQGNRTKLLQTYDYNPPLDDWERESTRAKGPIWTRIFVGDINRVRLFAAGANLKLQRKGANIGDAFSYVVAPARYPFYDSQGKLQGFLCADLQLIDISQFLRDLEVSPSGQVFILERNGLLVGSSGRQPILRRINGRLERFSVFNSPEPLLSPIAKALQQQFRTFQAIQTPHALRLTLKQQKYFVKVIPWRDTYGLDWLMIISVPESDFMAQIYANNRTTILLCVAALMVATLLGLYTSRWMVQPILQLNQAAQAIAEGQLDQEVPPSRVRELGTLARSFNDMADQLRRSFTSLETVNEQLEQRVEERTTELKSTLQELQRTQSQMIQAEKMSTLGQLIAGIAHEINNPVSFIYGNLNHVEGYCQNLLELLNDYQQECATPSVTLQERLEEVDVDFLQEDLLKVLASMRIGADRIREIVKSLRTFSRIDESDLKDVDIHEGIESTLLILQHRFKAKPEAPAIDLVREYGTLPPVKCYPGKLNQVVMNIVVNALDALDEANAHRTYQDMRDNRSQIRIRTALVQDWVQIAIADNGPGIPAAIREHIFEPFFTTKPSGKGTGLGMSISYQIIVENHRGKLDCFSTPGVGTEFLIQIPARLEAAAPAAR